MRLRPPDEGLRPTSASASAGDPLRSGTGGADADVGGPPGAAQGAAPPPARRKRPSRATRARARARVPQAAAQPAHATPACGRRCAGGRPGGASQPAPVAAAPCRRGGRRAFCRARRQPAEPCGPAAHLAGSAGHAQEEQGGVRRAVPQHEGCLRRAEMAFVIEFPAENSFAFKAVQKPDVQDAVSAALMQACGAALPFAYAQGIARPRGLPRRRFRRTPSAAPAAAPSSARRASLLSRGLRPAARWPRPATAPARVAAALANAAAAPARLPARRTRARPRSPIRRRSTPTTSPRTRTRWFPTTITAPPHPRPPGRPAAGRPLPPARLGRPGRPPRRRPTPPRPASRPDLPPVALCAHLAPWT